MRTGALAIPEGSQRCPQGLLRVGDVWTPVTPDRVRTGGGDPEESEDRGITGEVVFEVVHATGDRRIRVAVGVAVKGAAEVTHEFGDVDVLITLTHETSDEPEPEAVPGFFGS